MIENEIGKKRESILERLEIEAPPDYVNVYHETKVQFLDDIDQNGLLIGSDNKNIGKDEAMVRRNDFLDNIRPQFLKDKGIGRNNIFAYPYLQYGHGLFGADRRFIKKDENTLRNEYETVEQYSPGSMKKKGFESLADYTFKNTDPDSLKMQYPGEILEMKVDPKNCYVADLEYITRIMDDIQRGWTESEALSYQGEIYWKQIISLEDFLKWYKKPEWTQDGNNIKDSEKYENGEPLDTFSFCLLKGAPENLPKAILTPEILIPQNIPQEYIKVVK